MQLSARTDIAAPLNFVFSALADFEGWETAALRRGAEVSRVDKLKAAGPGMAWQSRFRFRGKEREVLVKLTEYDFDTRMRFEARSRLFEADVVVEVVSLAPNRTRFVARLDVKPLTLGARLLLQSAKLAKGKIQIRFNKRLAQLAVDLEQRYASTRRR